jgi:hypothetical protein
MDTLLNPLIRSSVVLYMPTFQLARRPRNRTRPRSRHHIASPRARRPAALRAVAVAGSRRARRHRRPRREEPPGPARRIRALHARPRPDHQHQDRGWPQAGQSAMSALARKMPIRGPTGTSIMRPCPAISSGSHAAGYRNSATAATPSESLAIPRESASPRASLRRRPARSRSPGPRCRHSMRACS